MAVTGRGAWTNAGGTQSGCYELSKPPTAQVGSQAAQNPKLDVPANDYRAVTFGVMAWQSVMQHTVDPHIVADGWFGPATSGDAGKLQATYGADQDRSLGPNSARAVFGALIKLAEESHGIPGHLLCGIAMQESELDPGAVGFATPGDKGLMQINTLVQPVTVAQAFDPYFAIGWAANRFTAAWASFAGKGITVQEAATVLSWNDPAEARVWFQTGKSPSAHATDYVGRVLGYAATF